MSEVVQEPHQDFWLPPSPMAADEIVMPIMAEACLCCRSEFLRGSKFCHACGGRRPEAVEVAARADAVALAGLWEMGVDRVHSLYSVVAGFSWRRIKFPSWLRYLHFHEIKSWVGLSTASLVAFVIGVSCIAGALLVGLLTARNFVEWQAIQFYRAEWLLAATASFVAGILLKKPSSRDRD
jgi:uncharacterized membrane protein